MEPTPVQKTNRLRTLNALVFLAAGLLFVGWLINTPPGLLGKTDAVGYAVCHRIDARSFFMGDRQMPLCARCTGMYLGAVIGVIYQAALSRRSSGSPPWRVIAVLAVLFAAFGIDGLNSYLHLFSGALHVYAPQNWLRLVTGTGMGIVITAALFPAFNQTVWAEYDTRPALPGLRALLGLLAVGAVVIALVLIQNPFVLFIMALVSTAGVFVLLIMVYTMVWTMAFGQENRYHSFKEMAVPLVGGFFFALLQVGMLDLARYILTGTWDGFHLG